MSKKKKSKKKSVHITDGVDFICPFCKARCTTSLEHCAVLHTVPMCEKFEQLEPDEFLKAVNERRAN